MVKRKAAKTSPKANKILEKERAWWELVSALRHVSEVYQGKDAVMVPDVIQKSLTDVFRDKFVLL